MSLKTPLRYPGGKKKLSNFVEELLRSNDLLPCTYVEPFAGGAGLAIELLNRGLVNRILLNDIDPCIYSFWHSVLYRTEELCNLILSTPVTIEEWFKQKEINSTEKSNPLILGFSTFFLNRTNRSGIIKAGVIGGKSQKGKWKLDCRYNKTDLIARIKDIGKHRDQIDFYNLDAEDFLNQICPILDSQSLIYLDPPYYVKGAGLYENHYLHDDHEKLAQRVKQIQTPWLVSYDNHQNIRDLYFEFSKIEYNLNYSAQYHIQGSEVVFCNHCQFPLETKPISR